MDFSRFNIMGVALSTRTITTGLIAESKIAPRTRPSWLSPLY